jgi:inosine-uridine nucleoside N-ribohydrolase
MLLQPPGVPKEPAAVFDTGLSNADDVLAMALLFGLDGKHDIRLVATSVSRANFKAAVYSDAVGRFYAGAVSGAIGFGGRALPVGMPVEGKLTSEEALFADPLTKKDKDGKPAYSSDIVTPEDVADAEVVMRNALTSSYDNNAVIMIAGPLTNAARLLNVGNGPDWVRRKVKMLVIAGGSYPDGSPETNITTDLASAKKVFADWPTPIVAVGREIGEQVLYPTGTIEKDFAWNPNHPVADAVHAFKPGAFDSPTMSMAAVLYGSRPQETYFKVSEPGTIQVQDDGRTKFTPSASGKHKYLIADPAQHDRILKVYMEIASAKPVPRPVRIPRPMPQDKNKPAVDPKAPEVQLKPPAAK